MIIIKIEKRDCELCFLEQCQPEQKDYSELTFDTMCISRLLLSKSFCTVFSACTANSFLRPSLLLNKADSIYLAGLIFVEMKQQVFMKFLMTVISSPLLIESQQMIDHYKIQSQLR
jgi:hypothetical protein